jgi:hypothetical protein
MGKFQPGHSKLGGRSKGSENKVTSDVRQAYADLLNNNLDKLQNDLDSLKPYQRLQVILKLSEFVVPRLQNVEADLNQAREIIIRDETTLGLP